MLIRLKPREGSHLALDHGDVSHGEALCGSTPEHACMFGSVVGARWTCLHVWRCFASTTTGHACMAESVDSESKRTCLHGREDPESELERVCLHIRESFVAHTMHR